MLNLAIGARVNGCLGTHTCVNLEPQMMGERSPSRIMRWLQGSRFSVFMALCVSACVPLVCGMVGQHMTPALQGEGGGCQWEGGWLNPGKGPVYPPPPTPVGPVRTPLLMFMTQRMQCATEAALVLQRQEGLDLSRAKCGGVVGRCMRAWVRLGCSKGLKPNGPQCRFSARHRRGTSCHMLQPLAVPATLGTGPPSARPFRWHVAPLATSGPSPATLGQRSAGKGREPAKPRPFGGGGGCLRAACGAWPSCGWCHPHSRGRLGRLRRGCRRCTGPWDGLGRGGLGHAEASVSSRGTTRSLPLRSSPFAFEF